MRAFALAVVVAAAPTLAVAAPGADAELTLVLTDHHFRLTAPVESGRLVWHVRNEGSEAHQALVIRLPEGVSEFQERAWLGHGARGPRSGQPMGGIENLAPGKEASFTTDLSPGKYLLMCTIMEEDARHYDLGMIYRFQIE